MDPLECARRADHTLAVQWEVLVALCAYVFRQYGVASSRVYGYKDFGTTPFPGCCTTCCRGCEARARQHAVTASGR